MKTLAQADENLANIDGNLANTDDHQFPSGKQQRCGALNLFIHNMYIYAT